MEYLQGREKAVLLSIHAQVKTKIAPIFCLLITVAIFLLNP